MSSTSSNGSHGQPSHDTGETGRVHSADLAGDPFARSGSTESGRSSSFRDDAEAAKEQVREGASSAARDVKARATAFADEQKQYGAERLEGVADVVDKAAADLEQELPQAAGYVRDAARGLNDFSRNLRDRSVGDLLDTVNDFARREPAAFFGTTVLAGFVLSRFLKSTSNRPIQPERESNQSYSGEERHHGQGAPADVSTPDHRGSWPEMEEADIQTASLSETPSERPFDGGFGTSTGGAGAQEQTAKVSPTEPGMGFKQPGAYRQ
jgi:hypothetical protein